jgi:DNA-binding transcriptional regulator YdaS (Cro superfamily)
LHHVGVRRTITNVIEQLRPKMSADTPEMLALAEAIAACGGVGAFASAISTDELPVGQSKVSMWRTRGKVPPEYVPAIYRETLRRSAPVEPERLAPQVDWAVLREQASPAA